MFHLPSDLLDHITTLLNYVHVRLLRSTCKLAYQVIKLSIVNSTDCILDLIKDNDLVTVKYLTQFVSIYRLFCYYYKRPLDPIVLDRNILMSSALSVQDNSLSMVKLIAN